MSIDGYEILLLLHVLLFVYWLGADLAVLYSAGFAADPVVPIQARVVISRIMGFIDLFPRMSVPLIGAVGATLAVMSDRLTLGAPGLVLVWFTAAVWVATNAWIYGHRQLPERTLGWRRFDAWWRSAVALVAAMSGLLALLGHGITSDRSLAVKLLIFAAAIALSLLLRRLFGPYRPALARLASGSASDSDNATMQRALSQARPVVLSIWALTIAAAAIGLWWPL